MHKGSHSNIHGTFISLALGPFSVGRQEDTHEFIMAILTGLEKDKDPELK